MNPLTKVRLINELNEREASLGIKDSVSWHAQYKNSAWVFIGGFPFELTEGDIICVFSQYGEIANINLVRDKKTGKSKGFCFLCYEDQRSTILAVDNFNGIKIKGRTLRVDHVENYRPPKDSEDIDDVTKQLREGGCAPKLPSSAESESEDEYLLPTKKSKKDKKEKKKKKKEKKEKKKAIGTKRNDTQGDSSSPVRVKKEREDAGYEKYVLKEEPREERVGQRDRMDVMDRFKDMHVNSRRVRDREGGKGKDDLLPRQNRERYRESEREREKNKDRNREHETERNRNRDRENEREKERSRDKARDRERERDKDRQKERDGERAGKHREKDRGHDQEREADRGYTKHIQD